MRIQLTRYSELPAPLRAVQSTLRDDAQLALVSGGERLGAYWRWGEELYDVACSEDHERICWRARAVGGGSQLDVVVTLRDAVVATHATITTTLYLDARPWQRWRVQRRLARAVERGIAQLKAQAQDTDTTRVQEKTTDDLAQLRAHYPRTVEAFEAMDASEHLRRVQQLEHGWERITRGDTINCYSVTKAPVPFDYDLIYAGGGLGLIHAASMAQRYGWRVLVFDRGEVGCAHREWNISRKELAALVEIGFASWDELTPIIMTTYRTGLVRFYDSPANSTTPHDLWLPGVLDVALDAGALLQLARRKLAAAGGCILDHRSFKRLEAYAGDPLGVRVELERVATQTPESYTARLLLDGMGSTSPLALLRHAGQPFAGVCPTVGTVAEGFAQDGGPASHDPTLGDILVSVTDAQHGQQLMWEGFPGRGEELTVYLFYYDVSHDRGPRTSDRRANRDTLAVRDDYCNRDQSHHAVLGPRSPVLGPPHSLLALFEDYFTLLPTYKRPGASFRHLKPVYGYIPARHSLRRQEAPLLRGVLPVGDSAAQQSPLTFCGFGSHIRNLARTTSLLDYALQHDLIAPQHLQSISAFQANVSLNWVFSRFMHPWGRPDDVNGLQNIFLGVLNDLGSDLATRFFQDRMWWSDYHKMVLGMFARHRPIVAIAWRVLGPRGVRQWIADYGRFSAHAAVAALARTVGPRAATRILALCDAFAPALGLGVRARYAEWQAMGWL